jgi:hypothetical protein
VAMELGAAAGGSCGRRARLGADRRLGKPTAMQIGARRPGARGEFSGREVEREGIEGGNELGAFRPLLIFGPVRGARGVSGRSQPCPGAKLDLSFSTR